MSYKDFVKRVTRILEASGSTANFSYDPDKGVHIARCADGVTISGSVLNTKITVRWGDGHTAMANV